MIAFKKSSFYVYTLLALSLLATSMAFASAEQKGRHGKKIPLSEVDVIRIQSKTKRPVTVHLLAKPLPNEAPKDHNPKHSHSLKTVTIMGRGDLLVTYPHGLRNIYALVSRRGKKGFTQCGPLENADLLTVATKKKLLRDNGTKCTIFNMDQLAANLFLKLKNATLRKHLKRKKRRSHRSHHSQAPNLETAESGPETAEDSPPEEAPSLSQDQDNIKTLAPKDDESLGEVIRFEDGKGAVVKIISGPHENKLLFIHPDKAKSLQDGTLILFKTKDLKEKKALTKLCSTNYNESCTYGLLKFTRVA